MTSMTVYITSSEIARHFNISRAAVGNWLVRYPVDHAVCPTPAPDALLRSGRDTFPVWLEHRLPEWDAWREGRDKAITEWRRTKLGAR